MKDQKKPEKAQGVSPLVAGVTGAVVGAGVALAGASVLQDKNTQKKVKKVLGKAQETAQTYLENVTSQITTHGEKGREGKK
jgi:hypothetical protein